jgi:FAD/FMN-containing dehydrogenase
VSGALDELRRAVRGPLLRPGEPAYDEARRVWNARIDRSPAAVLRCADVADVVAAIAFARRHGFALSIRSSGHNAAGLAVREGGLTVDLSMLKGLHVDVAARRVRAQPGVTWGELDREAHAAGLATTGGRISTTGVAGLTLGGGYGWLMRKHGLVVDNLRSVQVVAADGRLRTASEDESDELFWGLRGGGGNLGVAVEFEYELHPIPPRVTGGAFFYAASRTRELLELYRDRAPAMSDDFAAQCNVLIAPAAPFVPSELHGATVAAIAVCHVGDPAAAARELAPWRSVVPPLLDRVGPMPYTTVQRLFDAAGEFGHRVHGRSGLLAELPDDLLDALADGSSRITSPRSIVMISPLGGAVARVGAGETAFSHRDAAFNVALDAVWDDPAEDDAHVTWVEELWQAVRPFAAGVYVNELGDEGESRVLEAYGTETYERLARLKASVDPANVFDFNQNVPPAAASPAPLAVPS